MAFRIIVCVKQVLDEDEIKIDKQNGNLLTENARKIINKDDLNALEEALIIKNKYENTHITVVTMGEPEAKNILLECLALGADDAVLISDNALKESDTLVTAEVLSAAIKKLGSYDLVLTGRQATGGDTQQVGIQLAELLDIPHINGILELRIENNMKSIVAKSITEKNCMLLKMKMPCLLTAVKELNKPRNMSIRGILEARKKKLKVWSVIDLGLMPDSVGLNASSTKVMRSFVPIHNSKCKFICDESEQEMVKGLLKELHANYIV